MRSLAVRMRKRLGDWFKVVQLLKTGSGGNDAEMEEAYNEVRIPVLTKSLWDKVPFERKNSLKCKILLIVKSLGS